MKQASLFLALVFYFAPAFAQLYVDDVSIASDVGFDRQFDINNPLTMDNSGVGSPSLTWSEHALGNSSPLNAYNPHAVSSSASFTASGMSSHRISWVEVNATWNDFITIGSDRAGANGTITVQFYNDTRINISSRADYYSAQGYFQTQFGPGQVITQHTLDVEQGLATDQSSTEYSNSSSGEVSHSDGFARYITETIPFTVGVPIELRVIAASAVNLTCDVLCNMDDTVLRDSSDSPGYGWYWGGIRSIDIDGDQGPLLADPQSTFDGFTVVSLSGMDYTRSYIPSVPEQPAWTMLTIGGLLVFAIRARRHFFRLPGWIGPAAFRRLPRSSDRSTGASSTRAWTTIAARRS
ncbi:MAG: hypothetical protein ACJ8IK_10355 [Burkholderiaceae bacterium]